MTPEQLNIDIGNRLGRNPLGKPMYMWINSDNFFHLMKVDRETETVNVNGLFFVQPKYRQRLMCPELQNTWILAHWHGAMNQRQWEATYGPSLLWPREGYYSPTNIVLAPGEEVTQTSNDQAVYLIKKQAEKTYADHVADGERLVAKKEQRQVDQISDRIDDSVSAFCNVPGTRSAHVQMPSYGEDRKTA